MAKAWAAWLHYGLGLTSLAKCARLLGRLGIGVIAGALCQDAQRTGTDLVPVQRQIVRRVNEADMVVMDETGWRVGRRSAWLWVATSRDATAYNVGDGRGFDQACGLVDEHYAGTIVRDGWAPYGRYAHATHQTCTAHLLRRCEEIIEDLPGWARGAPRQVKRSSSTPSPPGTSTTRAKPRPSPTWPNGSSSLGQTHPHDECRRLIAHLVTERDALFTFLAMRDVDATNWRGEQAIRPAVVNRKLWGGNRSCPL